MSRDSDYGEDDIQWEDEALHKQLDDLERDLAHSTQSIVAGPSRPMTHVTIAVDADDGAAGRNDAETIDISDDDIDEDQLAAKALTKGLQPSLWEQFRKHRGWGSLSVSDLVGPSWCEVQHTYRLCSSSHLPPEQRPTEIITQSGAHVRLSQNRVQAREVILDGGKKVHKALEIEAAGPTEEVKVKIDKKEEWWALRILNMIVSLETLIDTGLAREIPVFGFVDEFLVFGVVDEVKRRQSAVPEAKNATVTPNKRKATHAGRKADKVANDKADDTQATLDRYFRSPKAAADSTDGTQSVHEPVHVQPIPTTGGGFVVRDSKTRYNRSLPHKSETRASRLQCMLYLRLLSSLLTPSDQTRQGDSRRQIDSLKAPLHNVTSPAFDWNRLYTHVGLDPDDELTVEFRSSVQPVISTLSLEHVLSGSRTLSHFALALEHYGALLGAVAGVGPLEQNLEIVYRLRQTVPKWKPRKPSRKERAELELQRAVAESLKAAARGYIPDEDEEDAARALTFSLEDNSLEAPVQAEVARLAELDVNPIEEDIDPMLDVTFDGSPSITADTTSRRHSSQNSTLRTSPDMEIDLPSNSQNLALADRYTLRPRRRADVARQQPFRQSQGYKELSPPVQPRIHPKPPAEVEERSGSARDKSPSSSPPPSPPEQIKEGTQIGVERFRYNAEELDGWLEQVARLWKGEREPQGVSLEQTKRCRTCEFEESCEWRIKKAEEAVQQARANREALEAKSTVRAARSS